MFRSLLAFSALALFATAVMAQTPARRPVVRASGDGVVSIKPDQARISVSVTTTGDTAQEATDRNASVTTDVLNALRQLLGANADIKTLGYSLFQLRDRNNQPAGFSATNTVQVASSDLNGVGRIIDVASKAGATSIAGISFSLKDPQPARLQALRMAAMQAKASAEAIASGLGLRVGNVTIAEQGGSISPSTDARLTGAAVAPTTPVEVGTLDVRATVSVEAELVQ